jgi:hypothetical protein
LHPQEDPVSVDVGSVGLVERLTEAAAAAIADERPGLEYEPERLRGIVLDLSVNSAGIVTEGTVYVERQVRPTMRGPGLKAER